MPRAGGSYGHLAGDAVLREVADRMIAAADLALYSAKQRGRDRVDVAD